MSDIQGLRRMYGQGRIAIEQLDVCPISQFRKQFESVRQLDSPEWMEVNAMTLSTVGPNGGPRTRVVLLKEISDSGFVFFTNYQSAKGQDLKLNNRACIHFFWPIVEQQIKIEGIVSKITAERSDAYFFSRPKKSQIGAVVSNQSESIPEDLDLEAELERRFNSDESVQRPESWGGYELVPELFEFWQGRPSRLHDRYEYSRSSDGTHWNIRRLSP